MNLIPFLLIFIAAISFYSGYLLKNCKSYLKQITLLEGSHSLKESNLFEAQKTYFYYLPGKINLPKRKEYINFRENDDHYERSKCNLKPCFETKSGQEFLKNLLKNLYFEIFKEEESIERLIKCLKERYLSLKGKKTPLTLYQIIPEDKELKEIYLELLKQPLGTLSFCHLFFIGEKAHQKPLCFRYAKMPLFNLAIGTELSKSIIKYEKESYLNPNKKLKIEEIKDFLASEGMEEKEIEKLMGYFCFKEPTKTWIHAEKKNLKLGLESIFLRQISN